VAVRLEFINLIVPIKIIEEKYPGGWSGCLRDHAKSIGRVVWYDDHLFRTGAMDPEMMDNLIEKWTRQLRFIATEVVDGKVVWKDLCAVDWFGCQHDCDWAVFDSALRAGWLKGTESGEVVGRDRFRR